jgi:hypothetical protein
MHWLGYDWTDILLGTVMLALVPFWFAAYGGHVATETITDPHRRRRIKLNFWGLFIVGTALGFWQQMRGANNDRERTANGEWSEIFKHITPKIWVPPVETTVSIEKRSGPLFNISDPRSMINMDRKVTASLPIWVRYNSDHGDTVSPVAVAMYLDITSNLPRQDKVQNYSVAIRTAQCGWTYLVPIRVMSVDFYWLLSIAQAKPLDFTTNGLENKFEKEIPAFGTVSGWLFFDSRVRCETGVGEPIQFRITLHTFGGITFEKVTRSVSITKTSIIPGSSEANMTGMTFVTKSGLRDLSKAYVKFYGDDSASLYTKPHKS